MQLKNKTKALFTAFAVCSCFLSMSKSVLGAPPLTKPDSEDTITSASENTDGSPSGLGFGSGQSSSNSSSLIRSREGSFREGSSSGSGSSWSSVSLKSDGSLESMHRHHDPGYGHDYRDALLRLFDESGKCGNDGSGDGGSRGRLWSGCSGDFSGSSQSCCSVPISVSCSRRDDERGSADNVVTTTVGGEGSRDAITADGGSAHLPRWIPYTCDEYVGLKNNVKALSVCSCVIPPSDYVGSSDTRWKPLLFGGAYRCYVADDRRVVEVMSLNGSTSTTVVQGSDIIYSDSTILLPIGGRRFFKFQTSDCHELQKPPKSDLEELLDKLTKKLLNGVQVSALGPSSRLYWWNTKLEECFDRVTGYCWYDGNRGDRDTGIVMLFPFSECTLLSPNFSIDTLKENILNPDN